MRIDHHAYQQATRVAGTGLLLQAGIGLALLIFGLVADDQPIVLASLPVLIGILPWGGLLALFFQHKLERLEALEEDELSSGRAGVESVFDRADDEIRVAARRLRRMHQLFMPILSVVIALAMIATGFLIIRHLGRIEEETGRLLLTTARGWAVAICLGFSAVAFIFSRFVAGMAKQGAWQNLRGGAAAMVGISVVTLAISVGIIFRFFDNSTVIEIVTKALPWYLFLLAAEVVLNLILNAYRPRVPGEMPRPAFDSKLLSLVAAPDNIVRTINDAVNYQFGFDITSSWGYQLLLRSTTWLLVTGFIVVTALNTLVIVEPQEQAVKLAHGKLLSERPIGSGMMFKLPWPLQSAERYPVTRIRQLHLTSRQVIAPDVQVFTNDLGRFFDRPLDPFIVRNADGDLGAAELPGSPLDGPVSQEGAQTLQLVDAEIILNYRIGEGEGDAADRGLLDWLRFVPDTQRRSRQDTTDRRRALQMLALREVSQHLAERSMNQVLSTARNTLAIELRDRIQVAFDRAGTGIEVASVTIPLLRPHGEASGAWEEYSVALQNRRMREMQGVGQVDSGLAMAVGGRENAARVIEAVDAYNASVTEFGLLDERTIERRNAAEAVIEASGGTNATMLLRAKARRLTGILDADAEALRIDGQSRSYRAAPALYMTLQEMGVYQRRLPGMDKFVLGIDPSHFNLDFEFYTIDALTSIEDALNTEDDPLDGGP